MRWPTRPLSEVADFMLGKMLDQNKNKGELRPYLANINVRWGGFELQDLRTMRFQPGESERYGLKDGDIVMCEGGEPGRCAIWREQIDDMMYQKALHRVRTKDKASSRFLYYCFLRMGQTGEFSQFYTGSTIKHLPKEKLALIQVPYPKQEIQISISERLGRYDDLIENNRRRIKLLEEAARLIYREWFVNLRFPGHEHTTIVNGVPEGWRLASVRDLGTILTGKTPSTKDPTNYGKEVPFVKTPDMHGRVFTIKTETYLSEIGANSQSNKLLPPLSVLVSCIGTVGIVSMTSEPCQFNQQINALIPMTGMSSYYCYYALKDLKPLMEGYGGGATMPNVSKSKFETLPVLLPSDSLIRLFDEFVSALFAKILNLDKQNDKLQQARDLLLPRLMSGEIEV